VGLAYAREFGPMGLKLRASYGKSIRPPYFGAADASVSQYTVVLANPRLAPESQRGFDAGFELYVGRHASIDVTYFNQTVNNLIDFVAIDPLSVPSIYQNQNVGRIKNKGWELRASSSIGPVSLTGTYSPITSRILALGPAYTGDLLPGDRLLGIAKASGSFNLSYRLPRGTVGVGMTYVGGWTNRDGIAEDSLIYGLAPSRGSSRAYWIGYPGFQKYSASASYDIGRGITAFVRVDNLTKRYVFEADNTVVSRGRTTMAGARFRF